MSTAIKKLFNTLVGKTKPIPTVHMLGKWNPLGTTADINKRIDMANMDNCCYTKYDSKIYMNNMCTYTLANERAAEIRKWKYTSDSILYK